MARPTIIIGVLTYPPDLQNGRIAAVRETWRDEFGWSGIHDHGGWLDTRFFFDNTHKDPAHDEIVLDAPTGLMYTSYKTWRLAQWALEHNYDYAFIVPTDCYVCVPRLLVSGFEVLDYTGFHAYDEPHIGGGSGYWLSRRSLEAVAGFEPYADYEDRWVGAACHSRGIKAEHDSRYWSNEQPWLHGIITAHLSVNDGVSPAYYEPVWMRAYHKQYLERGEIWAISPIQEC